MMGHGYGMGYGMGYGGIWFVGILLVAGLAALVVVAVLVAGGRLGRGRSDAPPLGHVPASAPPGVARAVLDERYARGEIDTDEYVERLRTLGLGGPGGTARPTV